MSLRLSRRHWMWLLGTTPLLAQTTAPSLPPVAAAAPGQPADKAIADVHEVSAKLAALEVPMDVEPAFHFSA